jgi:FkbM family methyltransferase
VTGLAARLRSSRDFHWPLIKSLGAPGWLNFEAQRRSPGIARLLSHRLRSRRARFPLEYRPGESDLEVFLQIFVHLEYESVPAIPQGGLIIDCGANVGYSSAWFLTQFPSARLIAVEPDRENFRILQRNLEPFGAAVSTVNAAVWSRECDLVFEHTQYRDGRSWSVTVRETAEGEAGAVRGVDIPSLMKSAGASRIALLKVDVERSEIEIFGKSSAEWLPLCDTIVIELHDEECERVFHQAIKNENFEITSEGELTIATRSPLRPAVRLAASSK